MFDNLLVLELSSVLAGPLVGMFFAELGARVIKIENVRTHGDVTRSWTLESEDPSNDLSSYFMSTNFGKQSIALDLRRSEDAALCRAMITKADIVIHNFKPGDELSFGLSYSECSARNPQLIYAHVSGYGSDDSRVGYDALIQAESGYMSMNGTPGTPPTKLPVALMDVLAAHQLKEAILIALMQRERTGCGSDVHVALSTSALSSLANQASGYLNAGVVAQQRASEHPNIAPYGTIYRTLDGQQIVLAVGTDRQFKALSEVLNISHSKQFESNAQRVKNRADLHEVLSAAIATFSHSELISALSQRSVPVATIHRIDEALAKVSHSDAIVEDEEVRAMRTIAFDAEWMTKRPLKRPPHYDEHGTALRSEFKTDETGF